MEDFTLMPMAQKKRWSAEEYLRFETDQEERYELIDGEVHPRSGASRNRNLIVGNLIASLGQLLKTRTQKVYANQMMVRITDDHYYPDLCVTDVESFISYSDFDILLNPTLIVEVLSPSTERYDRGRKFELYRSLASMQEYILIAQDRVHVERYVRQPNNTWVFSELDAVDDQLMLSSIDCTLTLVEIYAKVKFNESDDDQADESQN